MVNFRSSYLPVSMTIIFQRNLWRTKLFEISTLPIYLSVCQSVYLSSIYISHLLLISLYMNKIICLHFDNMYHQVRGTASGAERSNHGAVCSFNPFTSSLLQTTFCSFSKFIIHLIFHAYWQVYALSSTCYFVSDYLSSSHKLLISNQKWVKI